jgi:tubulin-specific chaperone D
VQKAHYKTGNIRKLEAAIKLYGGIVQVYPEALQKLTSMLLHPFPKMRNQVADTLFVVRGVGKGVDWTKASKEDLKRLRETLESQHKQS